MTRYGALRIISTRAKRTDGRVAQLVEQRIENPRVEGSSPPPTTIEFKTPRFPGRFSLFELSLQGIWAEKSDQGYAAIYR